MAQTQPAAPQAIHRHRLLVGIYLVGMLGAGGVFGTEGCGGVLRYRVGVSLTGVCFFWIEPVCVGLGGEFSSLDLLGGVVVKMSFRPLFIEETPA